MTYYYYYYYKYNECLGLPTAQWTIASDIAGTRRAAPPIPPRCDLVWRCRPDVKALSRIKMRSDSTRQLHKIFPRPGNVLEVERLKCSHAAHKHHAYSTYFHYKQHVARTII